MLDPGGTSPPELVASVTSAAERRSRPRRRIGSSSAGARLGRA